MPESSTSRVSGGRGSLRRSRGRARWTQCHDPLGLRVWPAAVVDTRCRVPRLPDAGRSCSVTCLLFAWAVSGRTPLSACLALACAGVVGLTVAGLWLGWWIRDAGFARLARDARPLVNAIRHLELEDGGPPTSLDALPSALLEGLPKLELIVGDEVPERYDGNSWVLSLPASTGVLNWDQFPLLSSPELPAAGARWVVEANRGLGLRPRVRDPRSLTTHCSGPRARLAPPPSAAEPQSR